MTNSFLVPAIVMMATNIVTNTCQQCLPQERTIVQDIIQKHRVTYTNTLDGQTIQLGIDLQVSHEIKRQLFDGVGWYMAPALTPLSPPPYPQARR